LRSTTVRRWAWGLGISTATAVTAFGVAGWQASAAPTPGTTPGAAAEQPRVSDPSPVAEPAAGTGSDALTAGELAKARTAALTRQLGAAKDVTGAAGPEYLSAELSADSSVRRAELYFYDYGTDKLVKQVVDLGTGKLTGSYTATGMQQPAADREVATALDLVLAGPYAKDLRDRYAQATGRTWTGKQDVVVTAHVHQARPADPAAVRRCGAHRCLRLVVQAADGPFIDLDDIIIDLSGRTVARLK
jgi:hypothetical protein